MGHSFVTVSRIISDFSAVDVLEVARFKRINYTLHADAEVRIICFNEKHGNKATLYSVVLLRRSMRCAHYRISKYVVQLSFLLSAALALLRFQTRARVCVFCV